MLSNKPNQNGKLIQFYYKNLRDKLLKSNNNYFIIFGRFNITGFSYA